MREGERISAKEEFNDSVPSLLWIQPLPPSNPSVITQVLLNPNADSDLAMTLAMSPFLTRQRHIESVQMKFCVLLLECRRVSKEYLWSGKINVQQVVHGIGITTVCSPVFPMVWRARYKEPRWRETHESIMTSLEPLLILFNDATLRAVISASTLRTLRNCPLNFPATSSTLSPAETQRSRRITI